MDMPAGEEGGMEGMDMPMPGEETPPPPEPPQHRH